MTRAELKKMKQYATDVFRVDSPGYNRAMFRYHEAAVNYWDAQFGSVANDDEKVEKNRTRHEKARDKYWNLIKKGGNNDIH